MIADYAERVSFLKEEFTPKKLNQIKRWLKELLNDESDFYDESDEECFNEIKLDNGIKARVYYYQYEEDDEEGRTMRGFFNSDSNIISIYTDYDLNLDNAIGPFMHEYSHALMSEEFGDRSIVELENRKYLNEPQEIAAHAVEVEYSKNTKETMAVLDAYDFFGLSEKIDDAIKILEEK